MKKRIILPFALLFSILIVGFITLRSAGKSDSPCKESMEQCCKKKSIKSSSEGPIWETLSRQFFSFAGETN
jgi:hypothetical protein